MNTVPLTKKEIAMCHANDQLASKLGKARKAMVESSSLLRDAHHAHQRGDKAHVVTDHLERVIATLNAVLDAADQTKTF